MTGASARRPGRVGTRPGPQRARELFERLIAPGTPDDERLTLLRRTQRYRLTPALLHQWAEMLRREMLPFPVAAGDRTLDLCGSGGAPLPSFNVSTVSALVVASEGVPVIKHGNRSSRGLTGSTDLLEAWGLPVARSRAFGPETYRRYRLAFLHAPLYHPAVARVAAARRAIGRRTVFNLMGPLLTPVRPAYQLVGAPDRTSARLLVESLRRRGVGRVLGVTSAEGCDEFSPRSSTALLWALGDRRASATLRPETLLEPSERRGPWGSLTPRASARAADAVLAGAPGARRGAVVLTSGAALCLAGRAASLEAGVRRARELIDSGRPAELRSRLQELARSSDWLEETG
ncbi:MAG: anthranilate phosphoribosyltransferase [Thermoplasmata archaeon]